MKRIPRFLVVLSLISFILLGVFTGCPEGGDEPVDKSVLTAAITAAETNKDSVKISTNGSDVNPSRKWVKADVISTYIEAIEVAKGVRDNADATQAEIEGALTVLGTATSVFNNAKADGLKEPSAATFASTSEFGLEGSYLIFEEYEMKDGEGDVISLKADNIVVIKVKKPGEATATTLEISDFDGTLKFDVLSGTGDYVYSVETKDEDYYAAILGWTAPVVKEAELQSSELILCGDNIYRFHYIVTVDVQPGTGDVYRMKPTGAINEESLIKDGDNILNVYFRPTDKTFTQIEGDHTYIIKKGGVWYKSVIEYEELPYGTVEDKITSYTGEGGIVVIPTVIKGYTITAIGDNVFKENTDLESVSIPEDVTEIGEKAFYAATNLESVTFRGVSKLETIGEKAFEQCEKLESIEIPATVTAIGDGAFAGLTALTSLTIAEGMTEIPEGAFADTNALTTLVIPNSVTAIGEGAFYNCVSLTSITIGANVTGVSVASFNFVREGDYESIGFIEAYDDSSKVAGIYTLSNGTWSKN